MGEDPDRKHWYTVRTRSKELAELLSDLDRVRQERRKAKANRNKYIGTGNDGATGMSFGTESGSRYGGFGSDSLGGGGGGGGYDGGESLLPIYAGQYLISTMQTIVVDGARVPVAAAVDSRMIRAEDMTSMTPEITKKTHLHAAPPPSTPLRHPRPAHAWLLVLHLEPQLALRHWMQPQRPGQRHQNQS